MTTTTANQTTKQQPVSKEEAKRNKKLEKSYAKNSSHQHYVIAKRTHHWLTFKTWAIIFLVLAVALVITFVLMKYLNYYFNFGPMDSETAVQFKDANWWEPFDQWNWSIVNNFSNKLVNLTYEVNGVPTQVQIIIVDGLHWTGTSMAVAREALITNNFANGVLYLGAPVAAVLGLLLLAFHFVIAKLRVKSIMANYIMVMQNDAIKEYKLNEKGHATVVEDNKNNPFIIKETILLKEKGGQNQPQYILDTHGSSTMTTKPSTKMKNEESTVTKTTHVHKIQPNVDIEEHVWEKADKLPKIKKQRKSYPSLGKNDLIDEIYNDLNGTITIKELNKIYDTTFDIIVDQLDTVPDQEVTLFNFGKFKKIIKEGRNGVNPATGEPIWIEPKSQIKFSPAANFKKVMEDAVINETTTTKKTVKKTVDKKKG